MTFCQALESLQRVDNLQEVGSRIIRSISLRDISHHKVLDSTTIQLRNVVVTVITLRLERKEQSFLWETK